MRVLFCSTGGVGHLQPMRPLAAALQRLGHAVGWVTAPDALPGLAGQGLALFAAGPTFELSRRQFRDRHPEIQALRGELLSEQTFPALFGDTLAPAMLGELGAAVDLWRPDLMVLEPAALAAPLVCQLHGVPYATHGYGLPVPSVQLRAAMRRFGRQWEARGLEAPADGGLYRHLCIDIAPASLSPGPECPGVATLAMNPYADTATATDTLPGDLQASFTDPGHPRVYLSFGTIFSRAPALAEAARALLDLGAEVVVTIGSHGDPCGWGPSSPHLHVRRFVDQASLLPHCDAVVADHFRNARALAAVSAGIAVEPESQTAEAIMSQAARLLASARHATGAARLAREMRAMPVADEVARSLGALVSNGWPLASRPTAHG